MDQGSGTSLVIFMLGCKGICSAPSVSGHFSAKFVRFFRTEQTKISMFDAPRENEFTQGTVFSYGYAEAYQASSVYGLVITARCDAAQEKAPMFSYIPVVRLHDWMLSDGASIVMERIGADCLNTVKNYLKKEQLSASLLATKSLDEIYDTHFKRWEDDKGRGKMCLKMKTTIEAFKSNSHIVGASTVEQRRQHLMKYSATTECVVKELSKNNLSGFYLLREMPMLDDTKGDFVALLREIHHIPSALAREMVAGLTKDSWLERDESTASCPRFWGDDDLAAPVAKLRSPWIEHLMQNFSLLFSRIGVADNDFNAVKKSLSPIGLG